MNVLMKEYIDKEEKVKNSRLVFGDKEKENGLWRYLNQWFFKKESESLSHSDSNSQHHGKISLGWEAFCLKNKIGSI